MSNCVSKQAFNSCWIPKADRCFRTSSPEWRPWFDPAVINRERKRAKNSQQHPFVHRSGSRSLWTKKKKKGSIPSLFPPLLQLVASLLPRNWFSPRIAVSTEMELPLLSFNARVDCECATICRGDAAAQSAAVAMVWWIREGRRDVLLGHRGAWWSGEEPASSWGSLKQFRLYSRLDCIQLYCHRTCHMSRATKCS